MNNRQFLAEVKHYQQMNADRPFFIAPPLPDLTPITKPKTPKPPVKKRVSETWTWKGRTMTVRGWAEALGFDYTTLKMRHDRLKWSIERCLTTPLQRQCHKGGKTTGMGR